MTHEFPRDDIGLESITDIDFDRVDLTRLGARAVVSYQLEEASILGQVHKENPNIEIRPYQVDCLDSLQRARDEGKSVALVQMATGLGKTTVVASDVKRFLQDKPDSRVLFLCHQNDILRQARKRFEVILGKKEHTFGTFNGNSKKGENADCVFASFQTMTREKDRFDPQAFDYVVVDESHHGKAKTYEPTLKYFRSQFMLGATATPDRKDLLDIRDIFGKEIYSKSLAEALGEGLLAHPNYRVILDNIEDKLSVSGDETLSINELNRTFFLPKRDEEIAKIMKERLASIDNPRTIVFCPSIEHSERMQALLEDSKVINSSMNITERTKILDEFRHGDINTVLTVDLFNEGIDIADANAIVFLRSTQSETIFLQQLGRGLRKAPGKDQVLVLDFVANCDRLLMIEKLLHDAVEHIVLSRGYRGGGADEAIIDLYDIDFQALGENVAAARELNLGSFEFTETTRQILELINRACKVETSFAVAPEGYMSIHAAESELGINYATILGIAKQNKWEIGTYRFRDSRRIAKSLSSEQLDFLREHPEVSTLRAEHGQYSFNSLSEKLGIGAPLIEKMITEQGWQLPLRKFGPKLAPSITDEQAEELKRLYPEQFLPKVPDGWFSARGVATELGVDFYTAKKLIDDSGWELPRYKFAGGVIADAVNPEQLDILRRHPEINVPIADEGIISIVGLAKILKSNGSVVRRIATELGIQPDSYRFGRSRTLGEGVTKAEAEIITNGSTVFMSAPEGWKSITDTAEHLGVYYQVVTNAINKRQWQPLIYRSEKKNGKGNLMLSPEQIAELERDPHIQKLAERQRSK